MIQLTNEEVAFITSVLSQIPVRAVDPHAAQTIATIQGILRKLKGEQ